MGQVIGGGGITKRDKMAYGKPEQIDEVFYFPQKQFRRRVTKPVSSRTPGYSKMLKKIATRRMRSLGKQLMENAPNKNEYHGWSV